MAESLAEGKFDKVARTVLLERLEQLRRSLIDVDSDLVEIDSNLFVAILQGNDAAIQDRLVERDSLRSRDRTKKSDAPVASWPTAAALLGAKTAHTTPTAIRESGRQATSEIAFATVEGSAVIRGNMTTAIDAMYEVFATLVGSMSEMAGSMATDIAIVSQANLGNGGDANRQRERAGTDRRPIEPAAAQVGSDDAERTSREVSAWSRFRSYLAIP